MLGDLNISETSAVTLADSDAPLFSGMTEQKLDIDTAIIGAKQSIIHALHNNTLSTWQFAGQIDESTEWRIPLTNNTTLSAVSTGATLNSFFEYDDVYSLRLTATEKTESLLLTLTQSSNAEGQTLTSIYMNGEKIASTSIRQTGAQTLLNLPLNQQDTEYVIRFTMAESTAGNVGAVGSDSRCFIASLVFSDSPYILKHLRAFRDHVLLNLPFGDAVVTAYYAHSPFWVNAIQHHQSAIFAIQITLLFFFYLSPLLLLIGLCRKVIHPSNLKVQNSTRFGIR